MSVEELDTNPLPYGELALQTIAMPKDTNANGIAEKEENALLTIIDPLHPSEN